jgi:hypothetical protein
LRNALLSMESAVTKKKAVLRVMIAAALLVSVGSMAARAQSGDIVTSAQAYGLNPTTVQASPHTLPYTATRETRRSSTLADGTHIEMDPVKAKIYMDSSGRQRQEFYVKIHRDGVVTEELNAITIIDSVAGKSYNLSPRTMTASINNLTSPKPRAAAAPGDGGPTPPAMPVSDSAPVVVPKVERRTEELGSKTDSGMNLVGRRTTETFPVGSIGNDREIVVTRTVWTAPDLQLDVLIQSHDPRIGDTTTQVEVLSRDEPDPSLFQIPADYQVIEVPAHQ